MVIQKHYGMLNLKWEKFAGRFTPSVGDVGLKTGDRLILFRTDKREEQIFNERLVRDRWFNGGLRFELTFIPFFFRKNELNYFLDCCDLHLDAQIVRYFG